MLWLEADGPWPSPPGRPDHWPSPPGRPKPILSFSVLTAAGRAPLYRYMIEQPPRPPASPYKGVSVPTTHSVVEVLFLIYYPSYQFCQCLAIYLEIHSRNTGCFPRCVEDGGGVRYLDLPYRPGVCLEPTGPRRASGSDVLSVYSANNGGTYPADCGAGYERGRPGGGGLCVFLSEILIPFSILCRRSRWEILLKKS
eukprot:SAG31_NODE_1101_length_9905_cov_3.367122_7_plen_197_part_00